MRKKDKMKLLQLYKDVQEDSRAVQFSPNALDTDTVNKGVSSCTVYYTIGVCVGVQRALEALGLTKGLDKYLNEEKEKEKSAGETEKKR